MPRSKLGSVVHSVTSRDGSFTFRATDEWEATEIAPGGYEGAKEVIPEKWLDRHPHIFTQGATFRSWHEQSGECIWGGKLRERPSRNNGRADISAQGWGQLADRNAGRLLYMTTDMSALTVTERGADDDLNRWDVEMGFYRVIVRRTRHALEADEVFLATSAAADDIIDTSTMHTYVNGDKVVFTELTGGSGLTVGTEYFVISSSLGNKTFKVSTTLGGSAVNFTSDITAGKVRRVVGSTGWRAINKERVPLTLVFRTPGVGMISRFAANLFLEASGAKGACSVNLNGITEDGDATWFDALVLSDNAPGGYVGTLGTVGDVDLLDPPIFSGIGPLTDLYIDFSDLLNDDVILDDAYGGVWPAFKPSDIDNDYESWAAGLRVTIRDVRIGGIARTDYFSVSSVVRDLVSRLGIADFDVDDFGFNALPLDVRDGMTYGEALDHVSTLSNARWLIHDTGTRRYMDFGKFDKRVWTATDPHQDIDLLPLERFDRVVVPYRLNDGKTMSSVTVVADPNPLDYPNSYGRLRLNDDVPQQEVGPTMYPGVDSATSIGERLVDHLAKQRWGGSANLSHAQDHNGVIQSAYFVHAGDVLKVPDRRARARIAQKSMTNRGVHLEFETNYAPLDRILARREKRLQRV